MKKDLIKVWPRDREMGYAGVCMLSVSQNDEAKQRGVGEPSVCCAVVHWNGHPH